MFFGKGIKRKVAIKMNYSQAEIDKPPKITLQPEFPFFFLLPFFFNVINRFFLNRPLIALKKKGMNGKFRL